ncbi:MAG: hypothetical protein HY975_01235 [Candidatus Kerfeldbacteria bacterium]|nr:hypothetical protein [Candidatus Kerfeldbacteria bacterium]
MNPHGDLKLAFGYWLVSHKQTLRTWWAISLMALIGFSLLWMAIFFPLFIRQQSALDTLVYNMATTAGSFRLSTFQPQALTAGPVTVLQRDAKHVDLMADIMNSNAAWGATTVTAHFSVNGQAQPPATLFVNQTSRRPFIVRNVPVADASTATATVTIDAVTWSRAATASLPAAAFTIESQSVTPTTVVISGQSITTVTLKAVMSNTSVYNYYRVLVPVVVKAGDTVVAVDELSLDRWPTLTEKTITVTWPYAVAGATTATIEPQVSRFDTTNIYR